MMAKLTTGVFCAVLLLGLATAASAAQEAVPSPPPAVACPVPTQVNPYPYPYALDYYGQIFSRSGYTRYRIPYFALHPPVYYSCPVPRTYGYSPFAYPPGTMTPEVASPGPVVIQNKFVPRAKASKPKSDQVTQMPLRITNPYAVQANEMAKASQPAVASREP